MVKIAEKAKTFFDLFAGIGLVDYALFNSNWRLDLAVDYENKKKRIYQEHFPEAVQKYLLKDINSISPAELPNSYLGHLSFPCTDVSEAGKRAGVVDGAQSSVIDSVLGVLYAKDRTQRPEVLLTENVKGLLTSNKGRDIRYLLKHYNQLGYSNDLLLVDAKYFVPQSRQRVFILSFKKGIVPTNLTQDSVSLGWTRPKGVLRVISDNSDLDWTFLRDQPEPKGGIDLSQVIDEDDTNYWNKDRTEYFYSQMSEKHKQWVIEHIHKSEYSYATAFRRMRVRGGVKQSTAEIRTDGLAGCLRTAKGGSAKQVLVVAGKSQLNIRLLNATECARLMGAPEYTISPKISLNDYLFAFGDGVCASAIEWLDTHYLTPIWQTGKPAIATTELAIHLEEFTDNMSVIERKAVVDGYSSWRKAELTGKEAAPTKGKLYAALIALNYLRTSDEKSDWSFTKALEINSTQTGTYFGKRSLRGHGIPKLTAALGRINRLDLKPNISGEAGRTSGGTSDAALRIIQLVNSFTKGIEPSKRQEVGKEITDVLITQIVLDLEYHAEQGGIEVKYSRHETLSTFITGILESKVSKPGAVAQHLVGAKLEHRYEGLPLNVEHNGSSTADIQTNRLGDFDLGNTVIHVTKSPTMSHFSKAL